MIDVSEYPDLAGSSISCGCCGSPQMEIVYEINGVPTNSCILLASRAEAIDYPRGDIRLGVCGDCGFISNVAFDPTLTEYSGRYEETQAFSPTFNRFHADLVQSLVERHGLKHKDVIEIGCGKGEFLRLICEAGENRGLGFDPGYSEERGAEQGDSRYEVVRDFFSDNYSDRKADFVCSKMTLEHISRPFDFLRAAAKVIRRPEGVLFIQVPESLRIVRDCAFEDIYYEHCSYFTAVSMSRVLERLGLRVTSVDVAYDDQYLTVEASFPTDNSKREGCWGDRSELEQYLYSFKERMNGKIGDWRTRLSNWVEAKKKIVIWGSGSKGVAFLHAVGVSDAVECAVDINPYRTGFYMPGTGHEIIHPDTLPDIGPDAVIVMNRVYLEEIRAVLADMNLYPDVAAL